MPQPIHSSSVLTTPYAGTTPTDNKRESDTNARGTPTGCTGSIHRPRQKANADSKTTETNTHIRTYTHANKIQGQSLLFSRVRFPGGGLCLGCGHFSPLLVQDAVALGELSVMKALHVVFAQQAALHQFLGCIFVLVHALLEIDPERMAPTAAARRTKTRRHLEKKKKQSSTRMASKKYYHCTDVPFYESKSA
eukprot:Opistho-2@28830